MKFFSYINSFCEIARNRLRLCCMQDSRMLDTFLADRTNGRAYATVLRLSSSSVCNVMYCG